MGCSLLGVAVENCSERFWEVTLELSAGTEVWQERFCVALNHTDCVWDGLVFHRLSPHHQAVGVTSVACDLKHPVSETP